MISAAASAPANNEGLAAPKVSAENPTNSFGTRATTDFISKLPAIGLTPIAVYPTAVLSAQLKGGGTYREAGTHTLGKLRSFANPYSGSGAYVLASTLSRLPAAFADPLKNTLTERGIEAGTAEKLALGFSAVATGVATNFRNIAFTDGKHGLDGKKIFLPKAFGPSLIRDTLTGYVYAKALQAHPQQTRLEKVQNAIKVGFPTGLLTSVFDVTAYMAAKEKKLQPLVIIARTLKSGPIRGVNVAIGSGIMAGLGPAKFSQPSQEIPAAGAPQATEPKISQKNIAGRHQQLPLRVPRA